MMQVLLHRRRNLLGLLLLLSIVLYGIDYYLIGSIKELSIWFLGNLAFLPLYVLIVTLTLEQIIKERERLTLRRKLNMVIGVFFSEVGNRLFRELALFVVHNEQLHQSLMVTAVWKEYDYAKALSFLHHSDLKIDCKNGELDGLKSFLISRRGFLVGLLENQNLLEHENFTDLLWAVFHLVEELDARDDFSGLPASDIEHLNGDIKRVFGHISREWVLYMQHLKQDYPYLFSLAVRMNPMLEHPDAKVV
jgi:hypothetical protein